MKVKEYYTLKNIKIPVGCEKTTPQQVETICNKLPNSIINDWWNSPMKKGKKYIMKVVNK